MSILDTQPPVLIAAGLLGIAGYEVILRSFHPRVLGHDFAHGLWFGICFGLEILGLVLLRRARTRRPA